MNSVDQEIMAALAETSEEVPFEQMLPEENSPLNQPIVEQDNFSTEKFSQSADPENEFGPPPGTPLDAPEQVITESDGSEEPEPDQSPAKGQNETIPLAQAKLAADSLLTMANNVIAVGGGYFIKIKKHKEFYDFEEVIKVIDTQNEKNVQRIKLDEEDKALLSPLLALVIQKRAKVLTPEQQLLAAALSIIMKKAQIVMEVRAENQVLTERILDIIREEKKAEQVEEDEELQQEETFVQQQEIVTEIVQEQSSVETLDNVESEEVQDEN